MMVYKHLEFYLKKKNITTMNIVTVREALLVLHNDN